MTNREKMKKTISDNYDKDRNYNIIINKIERGFEMKKYFKYAFVPVCLILTLTIGLFLNSNYIKFNYDSRNDYNGNSDITPIQDKNETNNDTINNSSSKDIEMPSYTIGGIMIPAPPENNEITYVGEKITDEEAKNYFNKNYSDIASILSSNLKIKENGYYHIGYDGTEGKGLEVRQNYRDYLVYSDSQLIAIITLVKENGEISNTITTGASWLSNYNSYLQQHTGQKLIFLYTNIEIIIAPDNTYINPLGYDVSKYLEWTNKPYEWFYNEDLVYIP